MGSVHTVTDCLGTFCTDQFFQKSASLLLSYIGNIRRITKIFSILAYKHILALRQICKELSVFGISQLPDTETIYQFHFFESFMVKFIWLKNCNVNLVWPLYKPIFCWYSNQYVKNIGSMMLSSFFILIPINLESKTRITDPICFPDGTIQKSAFGKAKEACKAS